MVKYSPQLIFWLIFLEKKSRFLFQTKQDPETLVTYNVYNIYFTIFEDDVTNIYTRKNFTIVKISLSLKMIPASLSISATAATV